MVIGVHTGEDVALDVLHHFGEFLRDPGTDNCHHDSTREKLGKSGLRRLVVDNLALFASAFLRSELAPDRAVPDSVPSCLHRVDQTLALYNEHPNAHHDRVKNTRISFLTKLAVWRNLAESH